MNQSWGSWYYYDDTTTYSFANTFISTPVVQKTLVATTSAGALLGDYGSSEVTTTGFKGITIIRPTSSSVTGNLYITAIGKWK